MPRAQRPHRSTSEATRSICRVKADEYDGDNGRFEPGAFGQTIGTIVPLKLGDRPIGMVRIVAAVVSADGTFATLTYEHTGPGWRRGE